MGLTLAARSCSLLKVDPQVLHRHPVIGVFAAFATLIREGLKDRPISPPHCRHKCLDTRPLFSARGGRRYGAPHPGQKAQDGMSSYSLQELYAFGLQAFRAFDDLELNGLAFL